MKALAIGELGNPTATRSGKGWMGQVFYRDHLGVRQRVRRSGRTQAIAKNAAVEAAKEELKLGKHRDYTSSTKLADGIKAWLEYMDKRVENGARAASTVDYYHDVANRDLIPNLGQMRLGEVNTPRMDRYLQDLLENRGYNVAKTARTVLSGTCGWLVRQGGMEHNPVREVTPLEQGTKKKARALEEDQIRQWLALLDADKKAQRLDLPELSRFMLATGVGLGEALGVHWEDVDLTSGKVEIQRTVYRIKGKGIVPGKPKSDTSERTLILPTWAITMLKKRRKRAAVIAGPIFASACGTYRDRSNVGRAFRDVRAGTDFDWVKTHTYRKTVASLLDESGQPTRLISDQLGHSRISMTQDHYIGRKAVDSTVADALEKYDFTPHMEEEGKGA